MNYYGVTRSEKYLAHYGVLGMRWGQRKNARQLNRAYKALAKGKGSAKLEKTVAYQKLLADTKKERAERDRAYKNYDKLERDFYANKKLVDKHRRALSNKYSKTLNISADEYYKGMKYGDYDQGESYRHYLESNPKAMSAYKKNSAIAKKATDTFNKKAQSSIDESLGKYQNRIRKSRANITINGKPYRPTIGQLLKGRL